MRLLTRQTEPPCPSLVSSGPTPPNQASLRATPARPVPTAASGRCLTLRVSLDFSVLFQLILSFLFFILSDDSPCPRGAWCGEGSTIPTPCPPGTYAPVAGLRREDDCVACEPGQYCEAPGAETRSGPCAAGFACTYKATTSAPFQFGVWDGFVEGVPNGLCPEGHYCPQGTREPVQCPEGSYMGHAGAAQCTACDPGHYCAIPGLRAPQGLCEAGYYCRFGATERRPTDGASGAECPVGFYCPAGSATP